MFSIAGYFPFHEQLASARWVGDQVWSHNRFSVYSSLAKTAEAVEALSGAVNTQLKQGVNERVRWR